MSKNENKNFEVAKDIVASYEDRMKVIKKTAEDTRQLLDEFKNRREAMSQELRETLAQHKSLRKKDFDKMMEEILETQQKREENVKTMLVDFQEQEAVMVKKLREMLDQGEELRLRDFKRTLAEIREEQETRRGQTPDRIRGELIRMQSEVQEMLEDFKEEREKVASEWKSMVAEMKEKRKGSSNPELKDN